MAVSALESAFFFRFGSVGSFEMTAIVSRVLAGTLLALTAMSALAAADPLRHSTEKETLETLRKALGQVPERGRRVFELFYLEHKSIVEIAGLRIAGFGGAGPGRFGFPYEWDEDEADAALRTLLDGAAPPDILISHTPPARTGLDRTSRGEHFGRFCSARDQTRYDESGRALCYCGHRQEPWTPTTTTPKISPKSKI